MPLDIRIADPAHPAIKQLIDTHIAYGDAAYPAESNHHLTSEDHTASNVELFAAWEADTCFGMLGLLQMPGTSAEIKSMHVLEGGRGRGIGRALLEHVLNEALSRGITELFLETGSRDASAAARRLYERYGFSNCAPFGTYTEDPESVFMSLSLPPS